MYHLTTNTRSLWLITSVLTTSSEKLPLITHPRSHYNERGKVSIAINHQFGNSRSRYSAKRVTSRTYLRRRVVVVLAFLTFALALSFILPDTSAAAEQGEVASLVSQKHIVALTGDTFWTIAQRVDPYGNITLLVDQLVIINGGTVTPGQKILLP